MKTFQVTRRAGDRLSPETKGLCESIELTTPEEGLEPLIEFVSPKYRHRPIRSTPWSTPSSNIASAFFKPLVNDDVAVVVPDQHLDAIAVAVAKYEDVAT